MSFHHDTWPCVLVYAASSSACVHQLLISMCEPRIVWSHSCAWVRACVRAPPTIDPLETRERERERARDVLPAATRYVRLCCTGEIRSPARTYVLDASWLPAFVRACERRPVRWAAQPIHPSIHPSCVPCTCVGVMHMQSSYFYEHVKELHVNWSRIRYHRPNLQSAVADRLIALIFGVRKYVSSRCLLDSLSDDSGSLSSHLSWQCQLDRNLRYFNKDLCLVSDGALLLVSWWRKRHGSGGEEVPLSGDQQAVVS